MAKFKVEKKFSLDFLGDAWKECYINFEVVSIKDIRDYFPKFKAVDGDNPDTVVKSFNDILGFLSGKFISGKAVNTGGETVDLEAKDLEDLPAEVLSKALSFLSQGVTPAS